MADIVGTPGDDTLVGTPGDDSIDGGGGADNMAGLGGNDYYVVDNAGDRAVEAPGQGYDVVLTSISYTLAAGTEVEALSAAIWESTAALALTGNELANALYGNAGANVLDGGGGNDVLIGMGGHDYYVVDSAGDAVVENADEGYDVVLTSVSYALAAGTHVEALAASDAASTVALDLTGNEFTNALYGNAGDNDLDGGAGNDFLIGMGGNDYYVVDSAADMVIEAANEGYDVVLTSVSYALAAGTHVEALAASVAASTAALNLTGNEFTNALYGNAGANVIDGGAGNDYLIGLGGHDYYVVDSAGDAVIESANEGYDVVLTSVNYALAAGSHVEALAAADAASTAALDLTGNEFANALYGNAGFNTLDGGGGNDYLIGLAGNDYYVVDSAGDVIFENADEGYDVVLSSVNYALAAGSHVEALSTADWASTAALDLNGNEFANALYGNAGFNVLNGGGGNDYLIGMGGSDYYVVDSAGDIVIEAANEGYDVVLASVSYTLGAGSHVEALSTADWASTAALDLTGNEFINALYGNAGFNTLDGGGGNDYLIGLGGNDYYVVDSAGDAVIEAANEGYDVVLASVSYALGAGTHVEALSTADWASTAALDLTGNEFGNALYGNAGANILNGGGGADLLFGFEGNDMLTGGSGADTFAFVTALGAGNIDAVTDFAAGTDKISLGGDAGEPFAALASGALSAGAFVIGSAALQADDYILYNSTTGALLYDADGSGAQTAVQFATLGTGLSLTAADFTVSGPANGAPIITSGGTVSITENSSASLIVYEAAATDADNDRVTYSLGGLDAGLFTIDAVTGDVRLITAADYETRTSYSFNVIASDSGPIAGVQPVTLTVIDVIESVPTPIINETTSANDGTATAQAIDRNIFTVSNNPDLPNQSLPSATIQGGVATNNDIDFYAIMLQAGEQLILDIDHSAGGLDAFLRVYGPSGVEIGFNDDLVSFDPGSVSTIAPHNTDSFLSFRASSAGIYYFSVESFGDSNNDSDDDGPTFGESNGSYRLNVSIGPVATPAQIIDEDINALISGSRWQGPNLTYGFPTLANQYPAGIKETDNGGPPNFNEPDNFEPFNSVQQAVVSLQLGMISQVTTLLFALDTANPGGTHLRFAMSDEAEVAYAYYPPANGNPGGLGGSAWFNNSEGDFDNPVLGNYAWMGILHETGHALGLKHGHEPPAIQPDRDSLEYSVMTYRSYPGQDISGGGGYSNETWGYPQSLMMYDIAALQRIYGANFNTNSGNTVYSWSPATGQMSIDGAGQGMPGANRIFMTIWDGGGDDTYDLSSYTVGTDIDLRPGEWSLFSAVQRANLGSGGHFARGNVANALLYQGDTRSLIENAIGGSGDDDIVANQAANRLTGNAGADNFAWLSTADVGIGGMADTITDFVTGSDKIVLTSIDANPSTAPNDSFSFIGTGAFTSAAGEIRYEVIGGNAHVFGDVDGNGIADFEIIVNNVTMLQFSDFML